MLPKTKDENLIKKIFFDAIFVNLLKIYDQFKFSLFVKKV